jgi:hypothetical protein
VRPWRKVKVAKSDGLEMEAQILQQKQLKLAVIKMEGQIAEYCAQFARAERSMRGPSFEGMASLRPAHRDALSVIGAAQHIKHLHLGPQRRHALRRLVPGITTSVNIRSIGLCAARRLDESRRPSTTSSTAVSRKFRPSVRTDSSKVPFIAPKQPSLFPLC